MTPPAYTVPATTPGLLAPQLRALVLHERGDPSSVVVLRVDGVSARVWDGGYTAVGVWPVRGLHLDLRDRLTAAHVAWWCRNRMDAIPVPFHGREEAEERIDDEDIVDQATQGTLDDPEALAALVMRLGAMETR